MPRAMFPDAPPLSADELRLRARLASATAAVARTARNAERAVTAHEKAVRDLDRARTAFDRSRLRSTADAKRAAAS